MRGLRLLFVLFIGVVYVSGAILVGTLLASKAGPRVLSPDEKARWDASNAFVANHSVRSVYRAEDHLDALDAGPAQMKFLSTEEFMLLVAVPSCADTLIRYVDLGAMAEGIPNHNCEHQAQALSKRNEELPLAYTVAAMCDLRFWAHPSQYSEAFVFHDPELCLSTAAKVMRWKGYDALKVACAAESAAAVRQYPQEKAENLGRECVLQNVQRWRNREQQRCLKRQILSTRGCY